MSNPPRKPAASVCLVCSWALKSYLCWCLALGLCTVVLLSTQILLSQLKSNILFGSRRPLSLLLNLTLQVFLGLEGHYSSLHCAIPIPRKCQNVNASGHSSYPVHWLPARLVPCHTHSPAAPFLLTLFCFLWNSHLMVNKSFHIPSLPSIPALTEHL